MDERFQQICDWLEQLPILQGRTFSEPVPASSDASFRRYFRIELSAPFSEPSSEELGYHNDRLIIMDAPPQHEDCRPFIDVAQTLQEIGLNVPKVLDQDLQQGFLLLTDLGSTTYLSELQNVDESRVDELYRQALSALVRLQSRSRQEAQRLPNYDSELLNREMDLFPDWLGEKHLTREFDKLQKAQWQEMKQYLIDSALQQPQTYVHRDYHSRNLMLAPGRNPGILDFQDAVNGALTYDAVSLLRDCYIAWPREQVEEWLRAYFLELCQYQVLDKGQWNDFQRAFDLMGIQRHLKASGIFARLWHRDGKEGYLHDIPQTLQYIVSVGSSYKEMGPLVGWIENQWLPQVEKLNREFSAVASSKAAS
ncbi:aminoglycoside phosphotransferase family protein [Thiomicrorhabdus xiamenensis]|uniref:Phosphotransferase n=1 Tax=Thiomicrorhabdus xiamenensis TaxID=2739063 RepID=A0A7D4TGL2_9GAMM|nr:phosphotransferase [Thiomicrorhabdus xiamenensis]QKI89688.1 phosphotransferase [Thiomicrorhabdus xiamenensis]